MWKNVSRSIRSVFQNKHCSCNNVTPSRQSCNHTNFKDLLKLSPVAFGPFSRCYGKSNGHCCGDFDPGENKENPRKDGKDFLGDFHNNFMEALKLSGVFVVGWYLVQPVSHTRIILDPQKSSDKCTFSILSKYTTREYLKLLHYVKNIFIPHASILPKVRATGYSKGQFVSEQELDSEREKEIDETKLQNLEKAHQLVTGTLSNMHGAECMKHGHYSEAMRHFEEGARVNNSAALYNLGICHEMGLGTRKDLRKAAEMYKKASEHGHAAAMYNLAVFHIQGWGDVPQDLDEARKLFSAAADLGQPNAIEALEMENRKELPAKSLQPRKLSKLNFWYSFLRAKSEDSESDDSGFGISPPSQLEPTFA